MEGAKRAAIALCCLGALGCFEPPSDAQARLEAVQREGEVIAARLSDIEQQFYGNEASIQLYQELKVRHRKVSQLACANHSEHIEGIQRHVEWQKEKARRIWERRKKARVASANANKVLTRQAARPHRHEKSND